MSDEARTIEADATEVATGEGLLVRSAAAVLFIPEPDGKTQQLIDVFVRAETPSVAVGDALVEQDFAAPSLVIVEWAEVVSLLVFGDIELSTDQRSLPMLSGAGSATWVEHRLRPSEIPVVISVAPSTTDHATDLRDGTVFAGGFRLRLAIVGADSAVADVGGLEVPPPPPALVMAKLDDLPPPPVVEALDELPPPPVVEALAELPPPPGTQGPDEMPPPDVSAGVDLPPPPDVSGGVDLPPPPDVSGGAADLGAETIVSSDVATPGYLEFDDGKQVFLSSAVEIGRKPHAEDGAQGVAIDGQKVSRRHAVVRVHGDEVSIEDLGSRNGTTVIPHDGAAPEELEPGTPKSIYPGAVVHLGAAYFVYRSDPS